MQLAGAEAQFVGRTPYRAARFQGGDEGAQQGIGGGRARRPFQRHLFECRRRIRRPIDTCAQAPHLRGVPEVGQLDAPVTEFVRGYAEQGRRRARGKRTPAQCAGAPSGTYARVSGPATSSRPSRHSRSMQPSGSTGRTPDPAGVFVHTTAPGRREGRSSYT